MPQDQQNNTPGTTNTSPAETTNPIKKAVNWADTRFRIEPAEIKKLFNDERSWLRDRRKMAQMKVDKFNENKSEKDKIGTISDEEPAKSAVGLALSGGGIRSATFNLGLLQSLERYKLLWHVDYLSTVSGGGYIGSSLTWFKSIIAHKKGPQIEQDDPDEDKTFPFGTQRRHHRGIGGAVLAWLRAHGYYLTPGEGLTVWSLIAAILTGTLVNLVIMIPPFLYLFYLLSRDPVTFPAPLESFQQLISVGAAGKGFAGILVIGVLGFVVYGPRAVIYALKSKSEEPQKKQKKKEKQDRLRSTISTVIILLLSLLLILVSLSPLLFPKLPTYLDQIFTISTIGVGFAMLLLISLTALAMFVLMIIAYVISTIIPWKRLQGFMVQRYMRTWAGGALMYGILFAVVGTIPLVYEAFEQWIPYWIKEAMSAFTVSGVVSILGALRGRKEGNETKGPRSFFLSIGLALLIYGIFLWFYYLMGVKSAIADADWSPYVLYVSIGLAFLANTNQISMHRFYRNRLMEAYMPESIEGAGMREESPHFYPYAHSREADNFRMAGIAKDDDLHVAHIVKTDAPYHIINTNLQTVGSDDPKLNGRGGDNFIFSPLYCGAQSTLYAPTENYVHGKLDLATAFAISGAAVDPNTYATRSRPLSFLMTLLNIRLGYWIANPRKISGSMFKPLWWIYMFREMLGRGLTENSAQIHLSDGGHFENLGLYELVHRRCQYIIVSDAAADPEFSFADLAKVIEMARVDFGARIEIDVSDLRPRKKTKRSRQAFVRGTISYNATEGNDEATKAELLYIKTAVIDGLTEDIYGYRRGHDKFPDESTADQFFKEPQFEAYRELGFLLGSLVCGKNVVKDMKSFFERIDAYLEKKKKNKFRKMGKEKVTH